MFSGLRLRLTMLYLLAALTLIGMVGAGMYWLVQRYFQSTTDTALQQRMAFEFNQLGATVPAGLALAQREIAGLLQSADARTTTELGAVFVLPLSRQGQVLFNPNPFAPPIEGDVSAVQAALAQNSDLRTIELPDGTRIRLLTYRLTRPDGPAVLQAGRVLNEQDRALRELLLGLLVLSLGSLVVLGWGSWWLAGRSLWPIQRAWESQQSFIANASHELRSPLTLLRASAEVVLRSTPPAERDQHELLSDVLQECDHMTRLVDDLLLLSRLGAGRLKLERTVIALPALLTEIQRQVNRLASERGIAFAVQSGAEAICGDLVRLRQVLLIVIDNALRHTQAGGTIELVTSSVGRDTQICIRDTGSGIAPEHLPHLFERFYRVDSSRHAEQRGSGLGLSIAKALIEAQGGRIAAKSTPGEGTQIEIRLPALER